MVDKKENTYSCGHKSTPVLIAKNDIMQTTRYFNWGQDERDICFRCYLKERTDD